MLGLMLEAIGTLLMNDRAPIDYGPVLRHIRLIGRISHQERRPASAPMPPAKLKAWRKRKAQRLARRVNRQKRKSV